MILSNIPGELRYIILKYFLLTFDSKHANPGVISNEIIEFILVIMHPGDHQLRNTPELFDACMWNNIKYIPGYITDTTTASSVIFKHFVADFTEKYNVTYYNCACPRGHSIYNFSDYNNSITFYFKKRNIKLACRIKFYEHTISLVCDRLILNERICNIFLLEIRIIDPGVHEIVFNSINGYVNSLS